jgi:hypothetical protein
VVGKEILGSLIEALGLEAVEGNDDKEEIVLE